MFCLFIGKISERFSQRKTLEYADEGLPRCTVKINTLRDVGMFSNLGAFCEIIVATVTRIVGYISFTLFTQKIDIVQATNEACRLERTSSCH